MLTEDKRTDDVSLSLPKLSAKGPDAQSTP
jgi:hypothetical protein